MKKTLVLTHEYYPFKGGVARYCHNLFKFFKKEDYLVLTDNKEVISQDNIINTRLTWRFFKPSWLLAYFKLKRIIKHYQIQQIFTPNILPLGSLAYFLKVPYIISLHGLDINLAMANKPNFTKKILTNAQTVIANTENTANITRNFLGQADFKIKVVYPSVDFDTSYDPVKLEAFRKKLGLQDEKIVITLGRLNKRKGQDLVIEAIAQLKKEYNLKYFIIGRGLEKKNLELLIDQHKLSKQVFIFDNIDDEDLIYFFKLAHYFVMPFRDGDQDIEGFGTVFLEAALCNLPIISGNSGGIKEMFNDPSQAILIPSDDLRVLIKAMKFLLNNPKEADKLAQVGQERARQFKDSKTQSLILKEILK